MAGAGSAAVTPPDPLPAKPSRLRVPGYAFPDSGQFDQCVFGA